MENAALPLLNLLILGSVFVFGLRELGKLKMQAIEVRETDRR
ncbi:hypothetical protein NOR51B_532 [Luminiphilus syltensis NOR5-1B]|uniref:Uncharacterized protein n=1 Tax=Luminiphilus syltensis NOR5-1B TaxID=565045 RepID=B8KTE4_9GAMM|nr:hypothetical protein [Luminiphilus syltensis]EED34594.1 hypothetical protein NOR51B_532 [Luminiphilus syltensis NOR5-1B]